MARWQSAIQRHWANAFRPRAPIVSYTTEPAHSFLFARNAKPAPTQKQVRYVLQAGLPAGYVRLTKSQRLEGCLPGMGPLSVGVKHACLEFTGVPRRASVVEARSQADAPDESQARALQEQVRIYHRENHLRLSNPPGRASAHCHTTFWVACPAERPITVRGVYSAVRLSDLTGGVDVETTHARITLLDLTGAVHARVVEGMIDYSGDRGCVRLFAGWEINLDFPLPAFDGTLEATADGPVRVLLPLAFATSFAADLSQDAAFVCRADLAPRILRRDEGGRAIYTFGENPPAIRLVSIKGPIVIDNGDGPWEEAAASAMRRPLPPLRPDQFSTGAFSA